MGIRYNIDSATKVLKDTDDLEYNQVLSNEEIKENTDKANKIINIVDGVIKDKDLNRIYNDFKSCDYKRARKYKFILIIFDYFFILR